MLYRVFADNLFNLANRYGSIAAVCRDLGINRQQFNKYLSGKVLPSRENLKKLAAFFNVSEFDLFRADAAPTPDDQPLPGDDLMGDIQRVLRSSEKPDIKQGIYFVYFPSVSQIKSVLLRSCLHVFERDGRLLFIRYSYIHRSERLGQSPDNYHSRHSGVVLQFNDRVYLIGQCESGFNEITMLAFGPSLRTVVNLTCGIASTMSIWGEPVSTRVVLQYYGPKSRYLSALRKVGRVAVEDVDPLIRKVLGESAQNNGLPLILPFSLSEGLNDSTL